MINILIFLAGLALVASTLFSAIRTLVLPRGEQDGLTRVVFLVTRRFFYALVARARDYKARDRIMAYYAPMSLLALPPTWMILIGSGYAAMYWSLGMPSWYAAFRASGSALLTLGFANVDGLPQTVLMFAEAATGLFVVALLIAYLPTMYAAFSRRETAVALLEVRAGSPPSAVGMIKRFHRQRGLDRLTDFWELWEQWFADIEESHTSLAALVFFRSPQPEHSWVNSAGVVLDSAALILSTVDIPFEAQAAYCSRAGYLALRHIADFFYFVYNPEPNPGDPISITRAEFDAAYAEFQTAGIPLKPDRDQAWRDFAGWRVNYDAVLLALADLTMSPYAPWITDRSQGCAQNRKRPARLLPF
ncbi:MAG: hypothetical protein HY327_07350 [Chloroflexi bacterium]|nr:hypothetical protein [Chloroflexota bacterium]